LACHQFRSTTAAGRRLRLAEEGGLNAEPRRELLFLWASAGESRALPGGQRLLKVRRGPLHALLARTSCLAEVTVPPPSGADAEGVGGAGATKAASGQVAGRVPARPGDPRVRTSPRAACRFHGSEEQGSRAAPAGGPPGSRRGGWWARRAGPRGGWAANAGLPWTSRGHGWRCTQLGPARCIGTGRPARSTSGRPLGLPATGTELRSPGDYLSRRLGLPESSGGRRR
jgi:hypothetical protein